MRLLDRIVCQREREQGSRNEQRQASPLAVKRDGGGGRTGFRERFRDDELREIDLVRQEVGNDLLCVQFGPLHVSFDQHFAQARVDDRHDQATIVATNSLGEKRDIVQSRSLAQHGSCVSRGAGRPRWQVARGKEETKRKVKPTSIPFVSILSYLSGLVQYSPAYRFFEMRR